MLRRIRDRFDAQEDEIYEFYEKVYALRYNSITRICRLEFSVDGTRAYIQIDEINDVRFRKKATVIGFIGSGKGFDLEYKPSVKVSVHLGTVFVEG